MSGPSHDHKDIHGRRLDREKKIGHRRVNRQTGQVTYKKVKPQELLRHIAIDINNFLKSGVKTSQEFSS